MEERRAVAMEWEKRCTSESWFGFDHDACELLGAGIAEDDAAVFAKEALASERARTTSGIESSGGLDLTFTLTMVGVVLEAETSESRLPWRAMSEAILTAVEKAVAGGRIVEKDYVPDCSPPRRCRS